MFNVEQKNTRVKNPSLQEVPQYYTAVLKWSYILMTVYFICFALSRGIGDSYIGFFVSVIWAAAAGALLYFNRKIPVRWNLLLYSTLTLNWIIVFIWEYGWNCGVQHFIIPLMVISIFSMYDSIVQKVLFICGLFTLRVLLFFYCLSHEPLISLTGTASAAFQIINTAFIFANLSIVCLIFSTNIQESEKQLLIYNQELHKQANTDPLTTLPNRRHMMQVLERQIAEKPHEIFSVALGDIDLFKRINDTLGHNCGDEVLRQLAALFKEKTGEYGHVCRWGGEEFFFFFPGMNLDDASIFMNDLNIAVSKQVIRYKDIECKVTMTFGVEEYDYRSTLTDMVKQADEKLYYGKKNGRNRVIF